MFVQMTGIAQFALTFTHLYHLSFHSSPTYPVTLPIHYNPHRTFIYPTLSCPTHSHASTSYNEHPYHVLGQASPHLAPTPLCFPSHPRPLHTFPHRLPFHLPPSAFLYIHLHLHFHLSNIYLIAVQIVSLFFLYSLCFRI